MKNKMIYICSNCSREEYNWLGQCPECKSWSSFEEKSILIKKQKNFTDERVRKEASPISIKNVELKNNFFIKSHIEELDRVLGGGIAMSASILIGGEPGIGKSTLLLQVAGNMAKRRRVLYVSGEENESQIKVRAKRLKVDSQDIILLCESGLEIIMDELNKRTYELIIIDSVQTMFSIELENSAGSITQIRHCTAVLNDFVKSNASSLMMVAHVNKDGLIAGPKVLEHVVDVVLYFEDSNVDIRYLRSPKNRFGTTDELGIFYMTANGLQELRNPSEFFLTLREEKKNPSGVVVVPIYEGSRVLLLEIQVLCIKAKNGFKIYSDKIDQRKIARIIAILEKHTGLNFSDYEVFVNIAGGIKSSDVGADLGLAIAIFSARTQIEIDSRISFAAELSLSGELKQVRQLMKRKTALFDMGFKKLYVSKSKLKINEGKNSKGKNIEIELSTIKEVIESLKQN